MEFVAQLILERIRENMANLTERIRAIARDVQEGDSDGSLRDEFAQLSSTINERCERIEENIQQLFEDVSRLKQQGNA